MYHYPGSHPISLPHPDSPMESDLHQSLNRNTSSVSSPLSSILNQQTIIIPLVTTFSHRIRPLHQSIKHNFSTVQHTYIPLKPYRIISAFRKNKNLKDLLTKAKFSSKPPQDFKPHNFHFRQKVHYKYTQPHISTSTRILFIEHT